jgi:hypothetical protein
MGYALVLVSCQYGELLVEYNGGKMSNFRLELIKDGGEFDAFCKELFKAEYPDSVFYDDSMGDGGVDCSRGDGKILYQFYYPEPTSVPEKTKKIKDKITRTLKKVSKRRPSEWYIVIPCDAQETVHNHLRKQEERYSGTKMGLIDRTAIMTMLRKHPYIENAWLTKTTGIEQGVSPEAVTYGKRNDPAALAGIGAKIATSLRNWDYGHLYDHHIEIHSGKPGARWSLIPKSPEIAKEHPICIKGHLRYEKGEQIPEDVKQLLRTGQSSNRIMFRKEHIEDIDILIGSSPWRIFDEIESIELIPLHHKKRVKILLFDGHHRKLDEYEDYEALGQKTENGWQLNCTNARKRLVDMKLDADVSSGICNMAFNVRRDIDDASKAYEALKILDRIMAARTIEIVPADEEKGLEFQKKRSRRNKNFIKIYELTKKLKEISEMMRVGFPSILAMQLSQDDVTSIEVVHGILITGIRSASFSEFSVVLSDPNSEILGKMKKGRVFRVKQTGSYEHKLLDRVVNLGEVVRYFEIQIDEGAESALYELESGNEQSVELSLSPPNGRDEVVEFFLDWHSNPEEREKYEQ